MANSDHFDFMSIGRHCAQSNCKQLDYLPFTCDYCHQDFCVEHKKPEQHSCTLAINQDRKIVKCPLCEQHIEKGLDGQNDNTQVEVHIRSGCEEFTLKKRKKNKCTQNRCRGVNLMPLNCDRCYQSFCVRHRHPGDHNCSQSQSSRLVKAY